MKINLPRCGVWVFLSGLGVAASVCAGPTHTHGIAHLQIVVAGQSVRADFDLPGIDLLGFEHAPASVEEEALLEAAGIKLRDAAAVLVLTPAAHCSVVKVDFAASNPIPVRRTGSFSSVILFSARSLRHYWVLTPAFFRCFPPCASWLSRARPHAGTVSSNLLLPPRITHFDGTAGRGCGWRAPAIIRFPAAYPVLPPG